MPSSYVAKPVFRQRERGVSSVVGRPLSAVVEQACTLLVPPAERGAAASGKGGRTRGQDRRFVFRSSRRASAFPSRLPAPHADTSMATPLVEKDPPSSAPAASPLLKTTLSLVLLQLVSRLFSFSLNQLLLRSTTPQALGVATMGLEVVRDTGLFLVREGVRGAVVVSRTC